MMVVSLFMIFAVSLSVAANIIIIIQEIVHEVHIIYIYYVSKTRHINIKRY